MPPQLPNRVVYLDLDDVLVDFRRAACELLGVCPDEAKQLCAEKNEWNITKAYGVPATRLWDKITEKGVSFWTELKTHNYASELVSLIAKTNCLFQTGNSTGAIHSRHTYILTSSGVDPEGYVTLGKHLWLKRYFGKGFTNGIVTTHKHLLARPGAILIDDKPENCELWENAGGSSILFPGPVGSREHIGREVQFVRSELMKHILGD